MQSLVIKGRGLVWDVSIQQPYQRKNSMVEIELLKNDNKLGKKGNYIRKFLTEPEYLPILQKQEKHLIKIKRQAIVQKGNLRYIPPPDRLDRRRERDLL